MQPFSNFAIPVIRSNLPPFADRHWHPHGRCSLVGSKAGPRPAFFSRHFHSDGHGFPCTSADGRGSGGRIQREWKRMEREGPRMLGFCSIGARVLSTRMGTDSLRSHRWTRMAESDLDPSAVAELSSRQISSPSKPAAPHGTGSRSRIVARSCSLVISSASAS